MKTRHASVARAEDFLPPAHVLNGNIRTIQRLQDGLNRTRLEVGKAPIPESSPHWQKLIDIFADIWASEEERRGRHQKLLQRRVGRVRSVPRSRYRSRCQP